LDLSITDMQRMQSELQAKYLAKWGGLAPSKARDKLLWLYGELGEVGDIIKKSGEDRIMNDEEIRGHFTEELCDVLMYLNDIMLCFDIKPEEIAEKYREKHSVNMSRW